MKNDGTKANIPQPPTSALEAALKKHGVDVNGNVYTVGVNDVMAYIEDELPIEDSALFAQLHTLDETSLALEIADTLGNAGILELVENAIRIAIRQQIEYAAEMNNTFKEAHDD